MLTTLTFWFHCTAALAPKEGSVIIEIISIVIFVQLLVVTA